MKKTAKFIGIGAVLLLLLCQLYQPERANPPIDASRTLQARVEVRTNDPGVSITPKIINSTDSTDIVVGAACTAGNVDYSGANQKQTLAMTGLLTAGIKKYRLQYTLGANAPVETWAIGELEIFATA